MKPDLVLNESQATGWLRTELYGDPDLAASYVKHGRNLLGGMRTMYGVNERIAAGEPGGFYRQEMLLGDGTRIEVITNDGHDTLRIHPVAPQPEPVVAPEQSRFSSRPYLWIGARIKSGGLDILGDKSNPDPDDGGDYIQLHLCVWEPGKDDEDPVILSNRHHLLYEDNRYPLSPKAPDRYTNPDTYPLQDLPFHPDPPPDELGINSRQAGICYTPFNMVQLSRAHMDHARAALPDAQLDDALLAPDDDGSRVIYDEVVLCDPDDTLKLGKVGVPQSGRYTVKVMAFGRDCSNFTPVEVELKIIVGRGATARTETVTFTLKEFTKYFCGALPKGYYLSGGTPNMCTPAADFGANPMAGHWWQGGAEVDIAPLQQDVPKLLFVEHQIAVTNDEQQRLVPPSGFEDGAKFPARDERCVYCDSVSEWYAGAGVLARSYYFVDWLPGWPVPRDEPGAVYAYTEWETIDLPPGYSIYPGFFGLPDQMPFEPDNNPDPVYTSALSWSLLTRGHDPVRTTDQEGTIAPSAQCCWKTTFHRDPDTGVMDIHHAEYVTAAQRAAAIPGPFSPNPVTTPFRMPYPYYKYDGLGTSVVGPYVPQFRFFPRSYQGDPPGAGWG